jgi:hypothetical protein
MVPCVGGMLRPLPNDSHLLQVNLAASLLLDTLLACTDEPPACFFFLNIKKVQMKEREGLFASDASTKTY